MFIVNVFNVYDGELRMVLVLVLWLVLVGFGDVLVGNWLFGCSVIRLLLVFIVG